MNYRVALLLFVFFGTISGLQAQVLGDSIFFTPSLRSGYKHYAVHSELSQGQWFRVGVGQTGIHRITKQDLSAMGFASPFESERIRIFGNGGRNLPEITSSPRIDDLRELSIYINDHGDGMIDEDSDYLLFYAEGPFAWSYDAINARFLHERNLYNDIISYFVCLSDSTGKRVQNASPLIAPADVTVADFVDHRCYERDSLNLIRTGKMWFGEVFNLQTQYQFTFDFPNIVSDSDVDVRLFLVARSLDSSHYQVELFDTTLQLLIMPVDPNVNTDYIKIGLLDFSIAPDQDAANLIITYLKPSDLAVGWLNYIEIAATRSLNYTGGQLSFRKPSAIGQGIAGYRISGNWNFGHVWDVTDPGRIQEFSLADSGAFGYFKASADTLREFIIFDEASAYTPSLIEPIANQDLHNIGQPDMIVITYPDFITQADRLADFRRQNDSLDVFVTSPQMIYNEFSSGNQDPTAIRDFLRMMFLRAGADSTLYPHYVLLFGDGSYDMKGRINPNSNFIPTYQTNNSHTPVSSFVSDDYYVLLGDGEGPNAAGQVDAGIGRLPVVDLAEATVMVDKILRYSSRTDLLPPSSNPQPGQVSNFAPWRNMLTFIADDEDGNLHLKQAETLVHVVDSLTGMFNYDKIYLDAYTQEQSILGPRYPQVHDALMDRVAEGTLILNYTGHGGETGLAEEEILDMSDIDAWKNFYNLPIMITATCEFSRYDNPEHRSAGEHVVLNPDGGASAILSTTRVAYAHSNMIINTCVLQEAFREGSTHRLGDVIRLGKVRSGTGVYIQNFTLLGDPSMKMAIPELDVVLTEMNGDSLFSDTLFACEEVSFSGEVRDGDGAMVEEFDGQLEVAVYDKPLRVSTLANDNTSFSQVFLSQQQYLYKGTATIENGRFDFSFTLPKDVSFRDGNARISLYARSMHRDGAGINEEIPLINTGVGTAGDGQGPNIELFMNNRAFVDGGITGKDVQFLADLEDEDGINFFGAGLGHDITMILDDDLVNPVVMNPYYLPSLDESGQGTVVFEMNGLSEGLHKISLKCWDVLNYVGEKEITFLVTGNDPISLNHVQVYPNPMTGSANFCFDRNETSCNQWVRIAVTTCDGRKIREWEQGLDAGFATSVCLQWDGRDDQAHDVPAGLYIFNLKLTEEDGSMRSFTGKISKM